MTTKNKINNVIRIPTSINTNFFRLWIEFLTPFHKLANREKDVLACIIKERFFLSKSIIDEKLLDKIVMSKEVKNKIKEECGISDIFFRNILTKLKKNNIIITDKYIDKLNPKFLPKGLNLNDDNFQFLLYFDLNGKSNNKTI